MRSESLDSDINEFGKNSWVGFVICLASLLVLY